MTPGFGGHEEPSPDSIHPGRPTERPEGEADPPGTSSAEPDAGGPEPLGPGARPREVRWHDSPKQLAAALRQADPPRVRRLHVFQLPPGVLGGLFAASFYDEQGQLHRCLTTYANSALLEWTLRPLREAVATLHIPTVEGRVELGRNTGQVLHYFLPGAEDSDRPRVAEGRRSAAREAWVRAAAEATPGPVLLRRVRSDGAGVVLCASAGEHHFLIRLEAEGDVAPADILCRLGVAGADELPPDEPLCRDIMGEWREA